MSQKVVIFLGLILLISSCRSTRVGNGAVIQKRKYRQGVHVQWKNDRVTNGSTDIVEDNIAETPFVEEALIQPNPELEIIATPEPEPEVKGLTEKRDSKSTFPYGFAALGATGATFGSVALVAAFDWFAFAVFGGATLIFAFVIIFIGSWKLYNHRLANPRRERRWMLVSQLLLIPVWLLMAAAAGFAYEMLIVPVIILAVVYNVWVFALRA